MGHSLTLTDSTMKSTLLYEGRYCKRGCLHFESDKRFETGKTERAWRARTWRRKRRREEEESHPSVTHLAHIVLQHDYARLHEPVGADSQREALLGERNLLQARDRARGSAGQRVSGPAIEDRVSEQAVPAGRGHTHWQQ